jgi:hypothetical protein
MACPACDSTVAERSKACPQCGFPVRDLHEAVLRVRVVAFALALIPLMYAVLIPKLTPVAHVDAVTARALEVLLWSMVAFMATVLLLWSDPVLGLDPDEAARTALRHGLIADLPAVFSLLVYNLGGSRLDCLALIGVSLLLFAFLIVRMPRLTAAMRWKMLVGFEEAKQA